MADPRERWLAAIKAMTASPELAERYLDGRLGFTTAVARELAAAVVGRPEVVYGVWLERHEEPVYVGQTTDGRRRLWDLPIGESHHLANSFPTEIWARVQVVRWGDVLEEDASLQGLLADRLRGVGIEEPDAQMRAIGLGLEHTLQSRHRPLMNRRKKRRDGSWSGVDWSRSSSVGATVAPLLDPLSGRVATIWSALAVDPPSTGAAATVDRHGTAVFPGLLARGQ